MYIGHYAAAIGLVALAPEPATLAITLPVALGVAWPDLVWPALVWSGAERVSVDRDDPLQEAQRFTFFPYSHSLVLSGLLALLPAAIIVAVTHDPLPGALFWLGALSHWLLDLVVHIDDLPILGFGRDRRVGAVLHLLNVNSFFGFSRKNPIRSSRMFAAVAALGYVGAIAWFVLTWR